MGNLLTVRVGNILTVLMGNVLTAGVGKVLDIYTGYFRGRYAYVKQWRAGRKAAARPMIQDEIPLKKPLFKMIFLIPGGLRREMIQDEILFQRIDSNIFTATGAGG